MRRLVQSAVVLTMAAVMISTSVAQPPRRMGGFGQDRVSLLNQKSVQEELKLTEDQIKEVEKLAEKQREGFKGMKDMDKEEAQKKMEENRKASDKAVAELLKEPQLKRLKEIHLQHAGTRAFSDPEVAEGLKITDDQKEKIKTIREDMGKEMKEIRDAKGDREETTKKMEALRKATDEKATNLLTDDQKKKLKEMMGEPFKGEIKERERPKRKKDDK